MKEIKKLDDVKCDKCDKTAVTKIEGENVSMRLCVQHEEEFVNKIQDEIRDKYEGLSQDEIMEKIVNEGDSIL